ncbi:kelch domain-containing protein 3-like [Actinia tenebrosa]|uniref:Kelch domain-containing protein 3-like n=1 Tax=Actinia tenebrosa TaxID=6105 RepID=A0A6P8IUZ1_ACTTE|nr:kelch domain-containing protein 3-like [Actinia tenebrosa]
MALHWIQQVEGGPRRVNHAAISVRDRFIFSFGGYCTGEDYFIIDKLDVHIFDIVTCRWTKFPTPSRTDEQYDCVPYMRYGHSAAVINDVAYIFGGRNDKYGACNTLYCFDTRTLTWSKPQTYGYPPAARDGHTACVIEQKMYIFGGYEEEVQYFLKGTTCTKGNLKIPKSISVLWLTSPQSISCHITTLVV